METIVQELGYWLAKVPGCTVGFDAACMIVRMPVGTRFQTVKVSTHRAADGSYHYLRLQSRACVIGDYRFVLDALRLNSEQEFGGLAMDTSTNPPVLDVVYQLVADELNRDEFVLSLQRVACFADRVEQVTSKVDQF